jgi:hypothetical protein
MGYITNYLEKKRKWSKTKIEWFNIILNILFIISLWTTLFIIVTEQQKCVVKINSYMVNFSRPEEITLNDLLVYKALDKYCHEEIVCYNHTFCEIPETEYKLKIPI